MSCAPVGSTPQSALAAAERYQLPFVTDSVAALVSRDDVQLVLVTVKVTDHRGLLCSV